VPSAPKRKACEDGSLEAAARTFLAKLCEKKDVAVMVHSLFDNMKRQRVDDPERSKKTPWSIWKDKGTHDMTDVELEEFIKTFISPTDGDYSKLCMERLKTIRCFFNLMFEDVDMAHVLPKAAAPATAPGFDKY